MAVEALVTPFLNVDLFQGLSSLHLAKIAGIAERMVFKPGDVIIREGTAGDAAYLIVTGDTARIDGPYEMEDEEELPLHALVGEMAMLIDTEHTSTVIAKSQVRALRLSRDALYELMQTEPDVAEHFIGKLTSRLNRIAVDLRRINESFVNSSPALPRSRSLVVQTEHHGLH